MIFNKQICVGCMSKTRVQHAEKFFSILEDITKFVGTPAFQMLRLPGRSNVPNLYEPIGTGFKNLNKKSEKRVSFGHLHFLCNRKNEESMKEKCIFIFSVCIWKSFCFSPSLMSHSSQKVQLGIKTGKTLLHNRKK